MQRQVRAEIGARMRSIRKRAHITVEEAAEAAGVQPLAVEKWERGASLPSLIELRELLPLYGVMACEVLYASNPLTFSPEESAELRAAAQVLSPALRARVDCLLAMMVKGTEPVWKGCD